MSFNPVDADTLARWTLEEPTLPGGFSAVTYPVVSPVDIDYVDTFADSVGAFPLHFISTSFAAGNTDSFRLGVPGLFGKRALALTGGLATKDRDFARGASGLEPAGAQTGSVWFLPYTLGDGLAVLMGKDYAPSDNNPAINGLGTGTYAAPFVSARISVAENADGRWQFDWTSGGSRTNFVIGPSLPADGAPGIGVVRPRQWNLLGWTWASGTLRLWLNGVKVHEATLGALDYGTHGNWALGASPFLSDAVHHINGIVGPAQIDNVARDATWWSDYYMSIAGSGSGDLAVLNMAPADFGTDPAVAKRTPITFTVRGSSHVLVALRYEHSRDRVIVYDDGFMPPYQAASLTEVVDDENIDFVVLPNGGWQDSIACLSVVAVDSAGNAINFGDES